MLAGERVKVSTQEPENEEGADLTFGTDRRRERDRGGVLMIPRGKGSSTDSHPYHSQVQSVHSVRRSPTDPFPAPVGRSDRRGAT